MIYVPGVYPGAFCGFGDWVRNCNACHMNLYVYRYSPWIFRATPDLKVAGDSFNADFEEFKQNNGLEGGLTVLTQCFGASLFRAAVLRDYEKGRRTYQSTRLVQLAPQIGGVPMDPVLRALLGDHLFHALNPKGEIHRALLGDHLFRALNPRGEIQKWL